jgi:MraZ protein
LVKLAGLNREVMLVGVQDHLEIWDNARWESYLAGKSGDYDRIAEQAFDEGPAS